MKVRLESLGEIEALLPQIATLQQKYDIHLIIDVCETRTFNTETQGLVTIGGKRIS
jgi:hypothetical protein